MGLMGFSGSMPLYAIHRYYIFVFIDRANKDACLLAYSTYDIGPVNGWQTDRLTDGSVNDRLGSTRKPPQRTTRHSGLLSVSPPSVGKVGWVPGVSWGVNRHIAWYTSPYPWVSTSWKCDMLFIVSLQAYCTSFKAVSRLYIGPSLTIAPRPAAILMRPCSKPFLSQNIYADFTVFYRRLFSAHCIGLCISKQLVI